MSKPNPFRARRSAGSASTTSPSSQGASSSQLTSPFSGDFIASAFFEPGPEESSYAAPSSLTPQQPPSSLASSDPLHRRQHKTVRIASPPVSAEGFAAGFGSGASTPTYTSPTLNSVFPAPTPPTSAAVAAGHSLSNNTIEERLVQRDPSAPFQNLTPRPGSPPPEPIPDPFDTSEAAAVRRDAIEGKLAAAGERERYAASVFDSVASTMVQQRPMSRAPAPVPSMTKRGQGERHTMGVDAFKRMLLTGDAGDSQEGQVQAYPQAQGQGQGQENKKKSGAMDVDEFKRLLLTGDTAIGSTTTTATTTTQHNRQSSSSLSAPTVPLPRRSPSTRQKQAAGADRGTRTSTPSTSTSTGISTLGEKPPPPPPRARHGRTVSVRDQSTASTTTNALPTLDESRRRSMGISRSASIASLSSISSITGAATTTTAPSPPLPRVSRLADTGSPTIPASPSSPSVSTNPYHTSSPSLSRSSSIRSSIGESAFGTHIRTPSIAEEHETPTSQPQQQGQRRPPTPPVTRRTSQYRRSVMGSKGVNTLSPGTVSGATTAAAAAAAAGPRAPPPPPSPRPRARKTSGSSSIHDEEASRAGSSRSSSFSSTRIGVFEDLYQAAVSSTTTTLPPVPATFTASAAFEHHQQPSSASSSVTSRKQSLPPPRPPPPRRRPGASSASEQQSQPQQQQQREIDLPSRQRSLHSHRRSASGGSYNKGPPPPPPPPPGRYDGASDWGRGIGRSGNVEGTMGDEKAYMMAPSHAADVLADLTRLQQEIDAYRMKSAT